MDTKLAHKAVKAALLARSADLALGNEDEARQAGRTAGELAAKAGMTLTQLDGESQLSKAAWAWDAAVDAWYELQPKDVTEAEVDQLMSDLGTAWDRRRGDLRDTVARMWSELQRRRGA